MLVIFEGLDKSGKTFYANLLKEANKGSVLIKRMHDERLYPIDYDEGSKYDWQAMYDRIILSNPDTLFIADRSFFTHIIYQTCLKPIGTVKDEHIEWFNKYVKVLTSMPHLVVYMESSRYELDSMISNRNLRDSIAKIYDKTLNDIENLNLLKINIDDYDLYGVMNQINKRMK